MNNNIFQNDLILKVQLIPAKKFKNIKKTINKATEKIKNH